MGGKTDPTQQHSYGTNHQNEEFDLDATGAVKWTRLYNQVWGGSEQRYGGANMTFCNASGQCYDTHPSDGIYCPPYDSDPNYLDICEQTEDKGFYQRIWHTLALLERDRLCNHWLQQCDRICQDYGACTWDGGVMWMVLVVASNKARRYYNSCDVCSKYYIPSMYARTSWFPPTPGGYEHQRESFTFFWWLYEA